MLKALRRSQAGDTIVEVMIALSVLSLAFAISFATANSGLLQARNAEEHSEALEGLDSQLEQLREAAPYYSMTIGSNHPSDIFGNSGADHTFCMHASAVAGNPPLVVAFPAAYRHDDTSANDNFSQYPGGPNGCVSGLYNYSIVYYPTGEDGGVANDDEFQLYVRWNGIGGFGVQQEELTYRIHQE